MLHGHFPPPTTLIHNAFVAVPLTVADARIDHAAYMASPDVIRTHSDGRWPLEDFTVQQDAKLIAMHETDRREGRAFAFLLRHPARHESLGCVYLNPLQDYLVGSCADSASLGAFPPATAMVTFWVRQDLQSSGIPADVVRAVDRWVSDEWPVSAHVFRVLPTEGATQQALKRSGLQRLRLRLDCEPRPYEWYRGTPADGGEGNDS